MVAESGPQGKRRRLNLSPRNYVYRQLILTLTPGTVVHLRLRLGKIRLKSGRDCVFG